MSSPLTSHTASVEQLRKFAAGGYLYAILDAYQAPAVPPKVQELGKERALSLFVGTAEQKYWELAPYLIAVEEATLDWILQDLGSQPWGVFALSKSGLETLRTHFRRFLIVQLPDGERWYFRYYDPRILTIYLSKCLPHELEIFYGPIRGFAIPDVDTGDISLFYMTEGPRIENISPPPLWQVRPERLEALQQASQGDLEANIIGQLRSVLPEQYRRLSDQDMRKAVRYGLERAKSHRITKETDVARYIGLMFAFGADFDRDPALPWAAAILGDPGLPDPIAKLDRLWQAGEKVIAQARAIRTGAS